MGEKLTLILLFLSSWSYAQSPPRGDTPPEVIISEEPMSCSGSVIIAIILTIIVIIISAGLSYFLYSYKRRSNSVKHKNDPESGISGGYDNPHFIGDEGCENEKAKKVSPSIRTDCETNTSAVKSTATNTSGTLDRGKSAIEKVLSAVAGGVRIGSSPKTQDDCCLEARQTLVPLQGQDFSGLGFTILGNMKEGIFVKDVLQRGPASESGKITSGDKIMAVTVLMDHMVYEDAHSILSYASPYPVILHLENGKPLSSPFAVKGKTSPHGSKLKGASKCFSDIQKERIAHPKLTRSQSFDRLTNIGIKVNNLPILKQTSPRSTTNYGTSFAPSGLPKEAESYVKREVTNRYSERAIDVPGQETAVKDDEAENFSVELTNVQVHRSTEEIDEEANKNTNEIGRASNQKSADEDKNTRQIDIKPKFGVKVLPEIISFKEKNVKEISIKKAYGISSNNESKLKMDGDNTISSISILSSKKENATSTEKISHSSSSSEEDYHALPEEFKLCENLVSDESLNMEISGELCGNKVDCERETENELPASIEPTSISNLTFFSHANFPQTTNSAMLYLPLDGKISENINSIDDQQGRAPVESDFISNCTSLNLDSQPIEISSTPILSPWSNEEVASGESTPDHELDDATLSEVNATDATKKRKYRYMLANSSIILPDTHQVEDVHLSENNAQELWENQSDEVKSLSLKVKSPNVSLETGQNISLDIDDSFYSANSSNMNMALDLDDIEIAQVGNVSDEKKIKVIANNAFPLNTDVNDASFGASSENYDNTYTIGILENSNDYRSKNNSRKISFTEFALSDTIPIDMTSLSFNSENNDQDNISNGALDQNRETFGSVFGFQGFKNRISNIGECELKQDIVGNTLSNSELNEDQNIVNAGANICNSPFTTDQSDIVNIGVTEEDTIEFSTEDAHLSKTEDFIIQLKDSNIESSIGLQPKIIEESKKSKPKMNFGFRGLSRSSSDTDEEENKVSSDPAGKIEKKSKIKTSLAFKFRPRSRSSDSEDSIDHRTVKCDPSGIDIKTNQTVEKLDELKLKQSKESKEISSENCKADKNMKTTKPLRTGLKKSSESEDDIIESRASSDPKGAQEKSKDSKSKTLKLGFKGFKNLKGKIQTEINKIRQESPLSDDDSNVMDIKVTKSDKPARKTDEETIKKKNVDMKMMTEAATAAKENRGKISRKSSSSSNSSEAEDNMGEQRKKKKIKSKKKIDKNKIVTTGVMQVELPSPDTNSIIEVNEEISAESRSFTIDVPNLYESNNGESHITENINTVGLKSNKQKYILNMENENQNSPKYIVKTEMILTPNKSYQHSTSIEDVFDKVTIERKIPRPKLIEERARTNVATDTDEDSYGSYSDIDHAAKEETSHSETSVNSSVPTSKRPLTDSEELKRKTASLGDLSRIHEGLNAGSILERAVSLDLNANNDNQDGLHVKRLKLPDSSATSIDEVDEKVPYSPIKLEQPIIGLKAASRWGTLEEALQLSSRNSFPQYYSDQSVNEVNETGFGKLNDILNKSVSNIEISGGCGPSITSLSSNEDLWNSIPYDTHPLSEIIPNSKGKTTITLQNNASYYQDNHYKSDSNIVVVPGSSDDRSELSNVKVQVSSLSGSTPDVLLNFNNFNSDEKYRRFNNDVDVGTNSLTSAELNSNKVTLTMITAEDSDSKPPLNFPPLSIPPRSKANQPSISPDLHSFDSGISAPVVTVNNDWSQCDPDVNVESSDLNSSDEYISPGESPQKSMTQISLDGAGVSGYMVQDGEFLKTVIISNPDLIS